jgi:hypothetical protein
MDLGSIKFSMDELIVGVVFGIFGTGYFMWGKKRSDFLFMGAGAGLMVYPYFTSGMALIIIVGVLLLALPFVVAKYF